MVNIFDLKELYTTYFGKSPYYIDSKGSGVTQDIHFSGIPKNENPRGTIHYSKKNIPFNTIGTYGQDIWFPVELKGNRIKLGNPEVIQVSIDACTVAVNLSKTIIRTTISERQGTVKEIFNVDDYRFTIRGFLIGKNRKVPEEDINNLKDLFESTSEVTLHGGYPEIFLDASCRIVISSLEFPEVQGKSHWIRPFTLNCESDFITNLEFKK